MSSITAKQSTIRVQINAHEVPFTGIQPTTIKIDMPAEVYHNVGERERIRNILAPAFTEILNEDVQVTFEDESGSWSEDPLPWEMISDELLQNGYLPTRPESLDAQMVAGILCEKCEAGGQIAEGFRGRGYRVYAVCPSCGAYQEI